MNARRPHTHRRGSRHHHDAPVPTVPAPHGDLDHDLAAVLPPALRRQLPQLPLCTLFAAYSLARHAHSPATISHQLGLPLDQARIISIYARNGGGPRAVINSTVELVDVGQKQQPKRAAGNASTPAAAPRSA